MRIAVFPGSFDPITLGHMDVLERAARLFDRVYVCVMVNGNKKGCFSPEERLQMLRRSAEQLPNVVVEAYSGLLAQYAREKGAGYLVKGVRNGTDFDYEYQLAQINRSLAAELETVLLLASPAVQHVSSTMAREMIHYRQPLSLCMPQAAIDYLNGRK